MTTTMMTTKKTKTDSSLDSYAWRPLVLGAAIAFTLLLTGCGSGDEMATPTQADPTTTTTSVTTTSPTTPPNPSELLATALAQYRSGYEFIATTVVNDQEAVVQAGRWLDDASHITVRSGDGEIEYIVTTDGQWARLPDGEWEPLDGAPLVTFPLEPMVAPQSMEVMTADAGIATIRAVYSAETVGLSGNPVEVVLDFHDGVLVGVSYTVDVAGNVTESITTLSPLTDNTPITAPTG